MLTVSDTGPLHYLVLIGEAGILPRLFGTVSAPVEVMAELQRPNTPLPVKRWAAQPPPWLSALPAPADAGAALPGLDDGERAAIALAASLGAALILMDDRAGAAAARRRGFAVTGTLGLLERAARRGWIDLGVAIPALRSTNFHVSQTLVDMLLARNA